MGNTLCKERHQPRRKYVKSPIDQVLHRPVNSIGQYEQNVYPNSINHINPNDKNGTSQKYFSSVPNLNDTGSSLNQSSILIPDLSIFDDGKHPPVVPPRRKKMQRKAGTLPAHLPTTTTTLLVKSSSQKDGFKDIFGDVRSSSCANLEVVDKGQESPQPQARATSCNDINSKNSEAKKKLHVGNRKSDQFLGENLSDSLSDEPYYHNTTLEMDEVDKKKKSTLPVIVAATEKVKEPESPTPSEEKLAQTFSSSLDKKAEFLMAMLDADEDERYKGRVPVEEPLFIAKKKVIKRHICDDDDHIKHCLHRHEKEEEEKSARVLAETKQKAEEPSKIVAEVQPMNQEAIAKELEKLVESGTQTTARMKPIQVEATIEAPQKVERKKLSLDMSLSEDSVLEQLRIPAHYEQGPKKPERDFSKYQKIESIEVERPTRFKKLSRENLPSPPATPPQKNGYFAQLISPDAPPRRPALITQMSEPIPKNPPELMKQLSDSSILDKKMDLSPTPRIRVHTSEFKTSTPISDLRTRKISAPQGPKEIAQALKNPRLPYTSTSSVANNLMDSLIKKAYGYQEFNPEDHAHGVHDISLTPTSTLQNRKISTPKKLSNASSPSGSRSVSPRPTSTTPTRLSTEDLFPPPRSKKLIFEDKIDDRYDDSGIDTAELEKLMKKIEPKMEEKFERPREKKLEHIKEEKLKEKMEQRKEAAINNPQLAIPKKSRDESLKSTSLVKSMDEIVSPTKLTNPLNDIIDEIYSKNSDIMMEFQAFLEKNLESDPKIDVTSEKAFVEVDKTGITSKTPEPLATKPINEKIKNPDSDNESDSQRFSDSFESSEEEDTIDKDIKIVNKHLKLKGAGGRRESIEDVDNWFNNYSGASDAVLHGKLSNIGDSPTYDSKQTYPFGKFDVRRGSMSDEFFEGHLPVSNSFNTNDKEEIKAHAKQIKDAIYSKNLDKLVEEETEDSDSKSKSKEEPEHVKKTSVASGILISWPEESSNDNSTIDLETKTVPEQSKPTKPSQEDSKSGDHSLLLKYFDSKDETENVSNK